MEKNALKIFVASLVVGATFFYTAPPVYSEEQIVTIKVPAVAWIATSRKARFALESMAGVSKVITDEKLHEVSVLFEDTQSNELQFKNKLQKEGFEVEEAKK